MSKEARRTLVVDLDWLEGYRAGLRARAAQEGPLTRVSLNARADTIDTIIAHGSTVNMEPEKVAGLAQALCQLVPETPWQRQEREQEQFYSEAQAVDADWTPSGSTA